LRIFVITVYVVKISAMQDSSAGEVGRPLLVPSTMRAVVTIGNGSAEDMLRVQEVGVPAPNDDEVLVRVLAAGMNNVDINTRVGWYNPESTTGGWNDETPFPMIQGTDAVGTVVSVGSAANNHLIAKRVLVRPCTHPATALEAKWMGCDFNGAFAEYVKVNAQDVFPVETSLTDVQLGAIPCAYGTAENMLIRAQVKSGDRVLITGGSGGVAVAALHLSKLRGAYVTSAVRADKIEAVKEQGADIVVPRGTIFEKERFDIIVDNVAGPEAGTLIESLQRRGRYVTSGAIAGPIITLDLRKLYLKDISLLGCTDWSDDVFPNLVRYIQNGTLVPSVSETFSMENIAKAQAKFMEKKHVGKIVLTPFSS
jgi:NADPH:quinone reductase-like Zn-dependent oxidoreductase